MIAGEVVADGSEQSGGGIGSLPGFVSESMEEMKKVSAPTRQETIQASIVTIFIVCFVSGCLFLLDIIFNWVMGFVFNVG